MHPHEFSGGMRQRAMIAMAITCNPDLLIADEPTTALDVTVQAQVLDLLMEIKDAIDSSILLITHDLGVVAGLADRVMVMYAGREAEVGTAHEVVLRDPAPVHARPAGVDAPSRRRRHRAATADPRRARRRCSMYRRAARSIPRCDFARSAAPPRCRRCAWSTGPAHYSACHYAEELGASTSPSSVRRLSRRLRRDGGRERRMTAEASAAGAVPPTAATAP